jgi:hypothetical protein
MLRLHVTAQTRQTDKPQVSLSSSAPLPASKVSHGNLYNHVNPISTAKASHSNTAATHTATQTTTTLLSQHALLNQLRTLGTILMVASLLMVPVAKHLRIINHLAITNIFPIRHLIRYLLLKTVFNQLLLITKIFV